MIVEALQLSPFAEQSKEITEKIAEKIAGYRAKSWRGIANAAWFTNKLVRGAFENSLLPILDSIPNTIVCDSGTVETTSKENDDNDVSNYNACSECDYGDPERNLLSAW